MTAERYETVYATVAGAAATVAGVPVTEITGATELIRDLRLDSLALYEMVIDLEETFAIRISDHDLDRIRTIDDAVRFVLNASGAPA
jgi:acyl carrier protein